MPYFFDRPHYQAIANLLKAMEIDAAVFQNPKTSGVRVKLENGSIITWSNSEDNHWALTAVGPDGFYRGTEVTRLSMEAGPEDVAGYIARFDYSTVIEDKTVEQERALREQPVVVEEDTDTTL